MPSPKANPSLAKPKGNSLFPEFAMASHGLQAIEPTDPGLRQKALDVVVRFSQARRGMLLLLEEDTGVYQLGASQGLEALQVQAYLEEPLVAGFLPREWESDPREAASGHSMLNTLFPRRAALVAPLEEAGARLGLLLLELDPKPGPRRNATDLLSQQLALLLRNAHLVKTLSERNRQLATATASLLHNEKLALTGKMAAAVAHQVRNPLSVIGANVQLLMSRRSPEDPDHAVMEVLLEKVRETNATIHQLMELARPMVLQMARGRLEDSIAAVSRFVQPRCDSQGVELRIAVMPGLPEVWLDTQQLQRCLLDLSLNALQAMPGGGRLVVAVVGFGTRVELRVEDTGPGISADMRAALFEPFSTNKTKNTGLGLYNVKRVCDAMGVDINVGEAEPHGASFRLSFPVLRNQPQPILESVQLGNAREASFGGAGGEQP
jgi:signal transduction histidine kinase